MTEKTRSRIQAAELSFLRRVAGLGLRDKVRSSDIQEELRVEPLLLHVERSQLRCFGHLVRMSPGRLPGEAFLAYPSRKRPRASWLAQEGLCVSQDLLEAACCPCDPDTSGRKLNKIRCGLGTNTVSI